MKWTIDVGCLGIADAVLVTAGDKAAHGVLTGAQRGIMHDAGWKSTLFAKASFVAPDIAGLTGHELARRRDPHAC